MSAHFLVPLVLSGCLLNPLPDSELPKGYLGIQIRADMNGKGILIVDVVKGGPAAKAGLKEDDLITHLNDAPVGDLQEFIQTIGDTRPGAKVTLKVQRNGREKELEVKVGKRPSGT